MITVQVSAHFVGERSPGDHVEAEVVAELFAGVADDLEAQTEAVAVGLGVAQRHEFAMRLGGDRDDQRAGGGIGFSGERAHNEERYRAWRRVGQLPPPLHSMRWPVT